LLMVVIAVIGGAQEEDRDDDQRDECGEAQSDAFSIQVHLRL